MSEPSERVLVTLLLCYEAVLHARISSLNGLHTLQANTVPINDFRKGQILFRCKQLAKLQTALVQLLVLEPNATIALSEQLEQHSGSGMASGAWEVTDEGDGDQDEAEDDGDGTKDVIKKATGSLTKARQFLKCDFKQLYCQLH